MKVLVAIDSFKGSLSSLDAGRAVEKAIHMVDTNIEVFVKPLADGGEGTVEALTSNSDSQIVELEVNGPLLTPVPGKYGIIRSTNTVVIEIALAAGLNLITPEERNPLNTSTYGVGELIKDGINKGYRRFIIGLGGSATNDGGVGMLSALGYEFLDKFGKSIKPGAAGLKDLYEIRTANALPALRECVFYIACDVTNPLCGENGCSNVFAMQKGATHEMIRDMDCWLSNYAGITQKVFGVSNKDYPGSGAAGGLGFAFLSFLNSELKSGIDIVLQETGIENDIKNADLIVTGEGRLDSQSVMGKAPVGIARLAKKYNKKVIAFSGCVTNDAIICNDYGIDAFFPILRNIVSLDAAMDYNNACENLTATAYQVFRLINAITL